MSIFDIGDAQAFFHSIKHIYFHYKETANRSTSDLLYVIMG